MDNDSARLAEPLEFEFSRRKAANRLMKVALTERMASWDPRDRKGSGIPSPSLINLYRAWGEGGYGVVVSGNTMVDAINLEAPGNMIIPNDAPRSGHRFEQYCRLAESARSQGALFLCQLSHAGRQVTAELQPDPVSASDVQLHQNVLGKRFAKPHAASHVELEQIVADFANAANYLEAAGWDGVQLHGAHGYLLAQFLSPTTNHRDDEYGAEARIENRARVVCDVARAVRQSTKPGFVLGIKINSVEFQEHGLQPLDAAKLCAILEQEGFDFVELSGGTYEEFGFHHRKESTRAREAYYLEFAELIAPYCKKMKVYITGGLRTVKGMVNALTIADGVGLGRPTTQEPYLGRNILQGAILGAYRQAFDQDNFGVTSVVSSAQMLQIGSEGEPFDGGAPENVKDFLRQFQAWMKTKADDREMKLYLPMRVEELSALARTDVRSYV